MLRHHSKGSIYAKAKRPCQRDDTGVFSLYKPLRFLGSNRNTLDRLVGFNLLMRESIKER
ncbi:MAG: hypothetical protein RLZZ78_1909, partial [Armatimonadota bacterium]